MSARRSSPTCARPRRGAGAGRCSCGSTRPGRRVEPVRGRARSCARRATGPGWPGRVRTGCGTPRRPRCCAPAASLPEIGQVLRHREHEDHGDLRQGRPTTRCGRWPGRGQRQVRHERAARGAGRLPAHPPRARLQAAPARAHCSPSSSTFLDRRRRAARSPPSWRWPGRGCPPAASPFAWRERLAVVRGFARYLARARPGQRGPAHRPAARAPTARSTPYLYSEAEIAALMAAARALRPRAARGDRTETLIGLLAVTGLRARGRRSGSTAATSTCDDGVAARARRQDRQAARRCRCTRRTISALRAYAGLRDAHFPTPSTPAFFVSARGTPAGTRGSVQRDVHQAGRPDRAGRPSAPRPAPSARPAAHLRRPHAARLVPRPATTSTGATAAAVHLSRARRPGQHLLVPARRARAAGARRRAPRATARERCHERARADAAGVLHRPADHPAPGQPAHDRRLPRHVRLLLALRRTQRTGKQPSELDIDDLDAPLIGAFLDPPRTRPRQQRPHPQRPPGRDPLAVPLRRAATTPSTPHTIARVLAIPPKRYDRSTVTLPRPHPRSTRCSPRPTAAPGLGRRDHALLLHCDPDRAARLRADRPALRATSTSAPAPRPAATARAARNASPR